MRIHLLKDRRESGSRLKHFTTVELSARQKAILTLVVVNILDKMDFLDPKILHGLHSKMQHLFNRLFPGHGSNISELEK